MEVGSVFERIEVPGTLPEIPINLVVEFLNYPIESLGNWPESQVNFYLRWDGGYADHLDSEVRSAVFNQYRKNWHDLVAPKAEVLNQIKSLPMDERKFERRKIRPFPGVTMTFEEIGEENGRLVIGTRVGNYAQIHPDIGICSPSFILGAQIFPFLLRIEREKLWEVARGMGVQIHAETADNYHIFGQRAPNVMGAGFIGSLGITPNITDEQMQKFITEAKGDKRLNIPATWLFDLIREDISEPDELNLQERGLQESGFESLSFMGATRDPNSGWMTLLIFCKLDVTSYEIEQLWSGVPNHEYNSLIFVKNNPQSLVELLSRPNIYPSMYGGYHAYFRLHHPELL